MYLPTIQITKYPKNWDCEKLGTHLANAGAIIAIYYGDDNVTVIFGDHNSFIAYEKKHPNYIKLKRQTETGYSDIDPVLGKMLMSAERSIATVYFKEQMKDVYYYPRTNGTKVGIRGYLHIIDPIERQAISV